MCMYEKCPRCGAALDPGEQCDCIELELPKRQPTLPIIEKKKNKHKRSANWGTHKDSLPSWQTVTPYKAFDE